MKIILDISLESLVRWANIGAKGGVIHATIEFEAEEQIYLKDKNINKDFDYELDVVMKTSKKQLKNLGKS